ncbi:alpha/beta hydrolase [Umezawaea endophytica]|uniref:Alpha/beta hydrolase n=1 Tax=Umezawaea endophytica TaxID=1654476 RepID=A0A9X2VJ95_9PSEU|nr:alpha/beta hydrolase [Umezawaea endophytica]MCS7477537.1 alpha/beta hydrolase [Umezawaea endophytica]
MVEDPVRSILRVLGTALSCVALVAGATAAHADTGWSPPAIAWHACPEVPEAECGTLRVPVDWAEPRGESFDLAVSRRTATDPARRIGVIVADPGGPGGSGAAFAQALALFGPEVRARFDVVGFDQRGTGDSAFVRCSEDLLGHGPSTDPVDQAGFDALVAHNRALIADCRARSGPVFDHADAGQSARDLDALRRALGERKVNYVGLSYGTVLGQAYAERFGGHLRSMILDSTVDHSADTRRFVNDRAASVEAAFTEFVKWCDRTPTCAVHGRDVRATWEDALDGADAVGWGRASFIGLVHNMLYQPAWAEIAQYVSDLAAEKPPLSAAFEYNYLAVRLATVCQDFSLRVRDHRDYARLRAEELRLAPTTRGSDLGHDEAMSCAGVTGPPANPPHRLTIRTGPKILIMNSRHDPATPYAWAKSIHRQAPAHTALLTYDGWGHIAYDRSDCTRGVAETYLFTLRTPAEGASCPAVEPTP